MNHAGSSDDANADGASSLAALQEPLLLNGSVTDQPEELQQQQQQRLTLLSSSNNHDGKDIIIPTCGSCCTRTTSRSSSSSSPPLHTAFRMNHNVALNLLLAVLSGISGSLWSGTVFCGYLKRLGHGMNRPVGNVEAANGLASLISALPVGYLADTAGRSKVIRAGGVLLFWTAVLHAALLVWVGTKDDDDDPDLPPHHTREAFFGFTVVMIFWGIGGGIVNGPAQALYADSTPAGDRSRYYTYLFVAYIMASTVGPILSIILFQTVGDDWNLYDLRVVLFVGLGFEGLNAIIMLFFDDRKTLDEDETASNTVAVVAATTTTDDTTAVAATTTTTTLITTTMEEVEPERFSSGSTPSTTLSMRDAPPVNHDDDPCRVMHHRRRRLIPYITFLSGLIISIGSGMTVKFFPLFFKDDVGLSPSQVQFIYVIIPIFMAGFSSLGQKLAATGFGRVQTGLVLKILGVSLLYCMVFFKTYLAAHPMILVAVYILRTSFMNATYPLEESVLMDYVPKEERARWKSLDSVASFGWCGSAALGGWMADKYDYTYTFWITALLQSASIVMSAFLIPLVPRQEGGEDDDDHNHSNGDVVTAHPRGPAPESTTTTVDSSSLDEPLLVQ